MHTPRRYVEIKFCSKLCGQQQQKKEEVLTNLTGETMTGIVQDSFNLND
jgi:hypothetical protein